MRLRAKLSRSPHLKVFQKQWVWNSEFQSSESANKFDYENLVPSQHVDSDIFSHPIMFPFPGAGALTPETPCPDTNGYLRLNLCLKKTGCKGWRDTVTPQSLPRALLFPGSSSDSSHCVLLTVNPLLALCHILDIFHMPLQNPFLSTLSGWSILATSWPSCPLASCWNGSLTGGPGEGTEWGKITYCPGSLPTRLLWVSPKVIVPLKVSFSISLFSWFF